MASPPASTTSDSRPLGLRAALPAVLALGTALFVMQRILPPGPSDALRRWSLPLVWWTVAGLYWWRSGRAGEPAKGWRLVGSLLAVWGCEVIGEAISPMPWFRPWVLLPLLPFLALGMLWWFDQALLWGGGIRRILEGIIFALSLFTLAWGSVLDLGGHSVHQVWGGFMADMVVHAVLLGITIILVRLDPNRLKGPLGWIALYLLVILLLHTLSVRALLQGHFGPAYPTSQLVPSVSGILFLAAFTPWTKPVLTREEGRGQNLWGVALVYFPFGLAMVWVLLSALAGKPLDGTFVAMAAVLSLILLIRQVIALRDQASFFRILQHELSERTRSLEEHQAILWRTHQMNLMNTMGAGLAHDFNNLLSVVVQEAEQGRVGNVVEAAQKASSMVRQLMNMAYQEERAAELFELGELIEARLPMLQKLCPKNLTLRFWKEPDECWMEADPLQIEQVILNLVINARDAIQGPGFIRLRLRRLSDSQALLEVEDSGPGMDEEVRSKLFQPFFTTKEPGKGTGLGLASVKAIMDSLGGSIDVITEVGLGTTFRLKLPTVEVD